MLNRSIFKAYDIRGLYPQDINSEAAEAVGQAYVKMFDEGEIILAHDIRHGSAELIKVIEESIKKEALRINKKITTRNIGLSTTPMFYFLVNHFNASGGGMITASHNPKEYNGIKTVRQAAAMVKGTEVLETIDSMHS